MYDISKGTLHGTIERKHSKKNKNVLESLEKSNVEKGTIYICTVDISKGLHEQKELRLEQERDFQHITGGY
jgi:hypothetical protein